MKVTTRKPRRRQDDNINKTACGVLLGVHKVSMTIFMPRTSQGYSSDMEQWKRTAVKNKSNRPLAIITLPIPPSFVREKYL
jgi:hypothetical protein